MPHLRHSLGNQRPLAIGGAAAAEERSGGLKHRRPWSTQAPGDSMGIAESPPEARTAAAAYPGAGETGRLRAGNLQFFRTLAESVGIQGPTAIVVIAPALLAGISGGGTALVELVAAMAMGFVAYAFVVFTRGFNSAGSVYGFTGAVAGPLFGFVSAWTLMLCYAAFAGGTYAATADIAQPAFGAMGLHVSWQVYAVIVFVLVMALAYADIKISATLILVLEGVSMLLVTIACSIVLAKGGFHGHAFSSAPFRPDGATLSVLGLGIVFMFSTFAGFEASATLGEESRRPRRMIPPAIAASLAVAAIFSIGVTAVVTNAYPSIHQLSTATVPLVTVTDRFVAGWMGNLVNFGAVFSAFGAALACAVGSSRILFALGRDAGPAVLRRTSRGEVATGRLCPAGTLVRWAAVRGGARRRLTTSRGGRLRQLPWPTAGLSPSAGQLSRSRAMPRCRALGLGTRWPGAGFRSGPHRGQAALPASRPPGTRQ
jgi:Amino acid permease